MRSLFALMTLTFLIVISCDENDSNDPIDYNPKVTEITYLTPPSMQISYSNEKIVKIEWLIDENLHSVTLFYYSDTKVDSSVYTNYTEEGSRVDSILSYYEYNDLNQLIRKIDKDVFSIGLDFENYHYNKDSKLVMIEKYDDIATNATIDSLSYDSENKLKIYKKFYATPGQTGFSIHKLLEKREVVKHDNYANPFYHVNYVLGIYYSTDFGYMTENNIMENTIQNDTPQSYNKVDLAYDKNKRVISIDDKIFFKY